MSTGSASRATTNGTPPALARVPAVLAREPERVGRAQRRRQHAPGRATSPDEVARVDRQPRRELEPARARRRREPVELGPRRLGVDVVDRHRRDAAPVVDAGVEQAREVVVGEVRRRLHVRRRPAAGAAPPRSSRGARRALGSGCAGHPRARLGAEVLDDHLLQVAVPLVQVAQRRERLEPLRARLADADQDPARERDPQLAGERDRLEPARRHLVGRGPVRAAALARAGRTSSRA